LVKKKKRFSSKGVPFARGEGRERKGTLKTRRLASCTGGDGCPEKKKGDKKEGGGPSHRLATQDRIRVRNFKGRGRKEKVGGRTNVWGETQPHGGKKGKKETRKSSPKPIFPEKKEHTLVRKLSRKKMKEKGKHSLATPAQSGFLGRGDVRPPKRGGKKEKSGGSARPASRFADQYYICLEKVFVCKGRRVKGPRGKRGSTEYLGKKRGGGKNLPTFSGKPFP